VIICHNLGGRLGTWGEWYFACQSSLSLIDMTGNWEWLDDAGLGNSIRIVGNTSCTDASNATAPSICPFRCCCEK
jgi:hypothetical protein